MKYIHCQDSGTEDIGAKKQCENNVEILVYLINT